MKANATRIHPGPSAGATPLETGGTAPAPGQPTEAVLRNVALGAAAIGRLRNGTV